MATTKNPPAPAPPTRGPVPALKTPAVRLIPPAGSGANGPGNATTASRARSPGRAEPGEDKMSRETLAIAFIDLARFQIAARRVKDGELVELLEDYYGRIVDGLKPAGGQVVKFMGDGALVVFAGDRVSQAARAILMLKADVDARLAKRKFSTPLVARVHAGEVMAGSFGPRGEKRYDVIGQAVNRAAAMRGGEGISLTSDAFAKLDPKTQKLFKQKGDYYVPS
jgi:class 3 adenylate cyclase